MAKIPPGKIAEKIGGDLDKLVRAVKLELFSAVIKDTRVKTGRLRGNWQASTGTGADGVIDRLDQSGAQAIADAVKTIKGDTVDYLTNNLPYAEIMEEKDSMVAKNVERVDRILRAKVKK